jgi:hypothetical protein
MQEVRHPGTLEHTDLGIQESKMLQKIPPFRNTYIQKKVARHFFWASKQKYRKPRIKEDGHLKIQRKGSSNMQECRHQGIQELQYICYTLGVSV